MHISHHYKRLGVRRLRIAIATVIISLFFIPNFIKFEDEGENIFTVFVDGINVGTVESAEMAEKLFKEARKELNSRSYELTFAEPELSYTGDTILWGDIDDPEKVCTRMTETMAKDVEGELVRAYEVKIKSYIVTLASKDEVVKLLQAAIDKYDKTYQYRVSLVNDDIRQLPVLVPQVATRQEKKEEAEALESAKYYAGFDEDMISFFKTIEPDVEKDFEDYDLGLISIGYGDKIEVAEVYVKHTDLVDVYTAIEEVTQEEIKNDIYKVVSGDTLSGIAYKVGLPMEDLIAMNGNLLEDENSTIRPDDELVITVPEPKLSIVRTEELYYEEDYSEPIEYILNDEWYTTDKVTRRQPSDGHRKVVAKVSFVNDEKTETEIMKEEVSVKAIAKIVEKGTQIPPSYIKPIYGGRVTSTFGYRNRPTKGASSYHKGIDWGTPIGTPVYASSGGTVAKAGWGSGYGYCIYINHPDGKQTRYGHLSKVLVSSGQSVSQGQRIALSGNTGVSTGPHLHFEILVGGTQVNPFNYVGR